MSGIQGRAVYIGGFLLTKKMHFWLGLLQIFGLHAPVRPDPRSPDQTGNLDVELEIKIIK